MPPLPDANRTLADFGHRDLLDILLVAIILFAVLCWLTRHVSTRGLVLLAVLVIGFIFARAGNLFLTQWLLASCLLGLALVWIVLYQSDLRRSFERAAHFWRSGRDDAPDEHFDVVETLADAVGRMSAKRMGALIALRGRESWERHIQGGIELRGRISQPLLESIFNTQSPGHDGAVLIEGGQIVQFAVHLPLSSNLTEVGEHGTRHTAALGLSEHCDALVIVVSEERGTISVAYEGRLERVGPAELKGMLEYFWRHLYGARKEAIPRWRRRPVLPLAVLALALAFIGWLLFG